MEGCEVTQTLWKALFIYTMLPFIRQHALEVLRLNKVLQSSPGLKRLKKLAIQMIPTKYPLSIKDFIHSFVHLLIPLFNKFVFIWDFEQGTGSGIGDIGGKKTFSCGDELQNITQPLQERYKDANWSFAKMGLQS